jgi:hypothetical protein
MDNKSHSHCWQVFLCISVVLLLCSVIIFIIVYILWDRDSSVGIATELSWSGNRIPVGARFFANFQTDPGAHPTSCTMGTVPFPAVKRPGRGADHPLLLLSRSRKSRTIPLPPSGTLGLLQDTFTYIFFHVSCAL